MRHAIVRLVPFAVLLSGIASAQTAEKSVPSGTVRTTPVPGASNNSLSSIPGGAARSAPSLHVGVPGGPTLGPGGVSAAPIATALVGPAVVPSAGDALPVKPSLADLPVKIVSPAKSDPATLRASSVLRSAARGVERGRSIEVGGLSVRQALDRAFDASVRGGRVISRDSAASSVAGRFQSAREKVARLVDIANTAPPADAPDLYLSAIKTAQENLPSVAVPAVTKAVLSFAARKAEISRSDLDSAAFTAAAAGQAGEAGRFVKAIDKWETLLGASGRPLFANGARVSGVETVPGLAASFALKLESLFATPAADAYRVFSAASSASGRAAAVYRGRIALGDSAPAAALSVGGVGLKSLFLRAGNELLLFLPGRALPIVADAASEPRLREAARFWQDAAGLGEIAARLTGSARLTVSRARGAFVLARRAAAAHEALTGESGAVSRIDALARDFEAGVRLAALFPADRLTPGLEALVVDDGGLRHWALRHAADARARAEAAFTRVHGAGSIVNLEGGPAALVAANLAAASKMRGLRFVAFGTGLWASGVGPHGAALLTADLRSTDVGGLVSVEVERGDAELARVLDGLGFAVRLTGRGLRATLDAQTISADAEELVALTADGAALITGTFRVPEAPSAAGLERLLSDVRRVPRDDVSKTALLLDGRSSTTRARVLGWVGELEAVAVEVPSRAGRVRVTALRNPDTGLTQYARAERPNGATLPLAAFAELLRAP